MENAAGKPLVLTGAPFYFVRFVGKEWADREVIAPEGAIVRRSKSDVKIWIDRKEWLRWHLLRMLPRVRDFLVIVALVQWWFAS